jgi:hypothetical protein
VSEPPPFLDPGPISDPVDDVAPMIEPAAPAPPPPVSAGPCDDCARYAQVGYVIGAAVGIAAGSLVAYVILRNRLAPLG